jgi:hypothetical protein
MSKLNYDKLNKQRQIKRNKTHHIKKATSAQKKYMKSLGIKFNAATTLKEAMLLIERKKNGGE